MVRKIIALAGAGILLATMAGPAFGSLVSVDRAFVWNSSEAVSSTGLNSQNNSASVKWGFMSGAASGSGGNRSITTGNARSDATAVVVANTDVCSVNGLFYDENSAVVANKAGSYAYTGENKQNDSASVHGSFMSGAVAGSTGARTIKSGNAVSESDAWTVVNTSLWSF